MFLCNFQTFPQYLLFGESLKNHQGFLDQWERKTEITPTEIRCKPKPQNNYAKLII